MKIKFLLVCLFCIFNLRFALGSGWAPQERALLETYSPELTDPYITSIKSQISRVQYDQPIKKTIRLENTLFLAPILKVGKFLTSWVRNMEINKNDHSLFILGVLFQSFSQILQRIFTKGSFV